MFYGFTGCALLRLRYTEPTLARPYRAPSLILPILFTCLSWGLSVNSAVASPLWSLAALGFIVVSVPVYLLLQHLSRQTTDSNIQQST